jgi:hypothetical protein
MKKKYSMPDLKFMLMTLAEADAGGGVGTDRVLKTPNHPNVQRFCCIQTHEMVENKQKDITKLVILLLVESPRPWESLGILGLLKLHQITLA